MIHNREYFNIHSWLRMNHGKANICENDLCKSINPKSFEWALLKGKNHKRDRNNYIQLCTSCHRKYDMNEKIRKKLSKSHKGLPNIKNRKKVVLNDIQVFDSVGMASKNSGVSITAISNNLCGLSIKTKVGKFKYYNK